MKTFNQILTELEPKNSQILMKRARLANKLAKTLRGKQRRNAYGVKGRALSYLVKRLPNQTDVRKDIILTDFVVVELKGTQWGLHMPTERLERGAV